MTPQEWQAELDRRFPDGANIRGAGFDTNYMVPRLMVRDVHAQEGGAEFVEIIAIPYTLERDFALWITRIADTSQGTILKGVNQSWFASTNVPTEGDAGKRFAEARKLPVFATPLFEGMP